MYESFIGDWLIPIVKPYLDPDQCGLKGFSITHYLIKLLDFVHKTLDLKKPHSVLAACIDLSKAFNRVDHTLVIQDLYDMHTPAWLLRIKIAYLSHRSMYLTYNGAQSTLKLLPGGGPQGAYLGGIIFIIKYNGALLRPPIPRPFQGPASKSKSQKVKFVDDGTIAVSVDLKDSLVHDPVTRPRPWNFHERTGHILPRENNLLQNYIEDVEQFTLENKMVINKQKTKVISFTKSRNLDFPPELEFNDGTETKIVGVILSQDLKWKKNTSYICNKARQKLWILRRLLKFNLSRNELFDVYTKEIRSILELAVPVWHSGLTRKQTIEIERIQKLALRIILKENYQSYENACSVFAIETLEERRTRLCLKFATKNLISENNMFLKRQNPPPMRGSRKTVIEPKCNFGRYYKSSVPYLSRLLNRETKM